MHTFIIVKLAVTFLTCFAMSVLYYAGSAQSSQQKETLTKQGDDFCLVMTPFPIIQGLPKHPVALHNGGEVSMHSGLILLPRSEPSQFRSPGTTDDLLPASDPLPGAAVGITRSDVKASCNAGPTLQLPDEV